MWLNRDGHDKYRYITLGFGNKLSRLAIMTDASSVDGESNSARMLPELTQLRRRRAHQFEVLRQAGPRLTAGDAASTRTGMD